MIIKKIELVNIRSHEHFIFEPASIGITSISGPNGAGKSTIIDAFGWCLFGLRLNGLSTKAWIRDGADIDNNKDTVEVKAYIEHGGKDFLFIRKILNNIGAQSAWSYEFRDDNWVELTGPAVTHTESFVRQLLGMDSKGFTTSVFVGQKKIDQIIDVSPTERGRIIEQLIGIESLTKSIDMIKSESRDLQKSMQILHSGDVDTARERVNEKRAIIDKISEELKDLTGEFKTKKESFDTLKETFIKEEQAQEKKSILDNELNVIKNSILGKSNHLTGLVDNISKMDAPKSIGSSNKSLADLEEELNEIRREIELHNRRIDSNKDTKKELEKILKYNAPEDLENQLKVLEESLAITREKHKEFSKEIIEIGYAIKSNTRLKKTLGSHDVESCPVCKQSIDNPEHLVEDYDNEIKRLKEQEEKKKEEVGALETEINDMSTNLDYLKEQAEIKSKQAMAEIELPKVKRAISDEEEELILLYAKEKISSKNRDKMSLYEQNINMINSIKEQIVSIRDDISKDNETKGKIEKELESLLAISKSDFNQLKSSYKEKETELNKLESDYKLLSQRNKLEKELAKELILQYNKAKEAKEKYDMISRSLEISNTSLSTLIDFKEERAQNAIPMVTTIASDILNRFTDGDFIEMKIFSNFDVLVVTKEGQEREVKALSGGELSSVSIALRLAISLFLQADNSGLLILDEILVSMSEERAVSILKAIQEVSNAQIIFIAHNGAVNSIADKVVQL